jgi:hypothetical protein
MEAIKYDAASEILERKKRTELGTEANLDPRSIFLSSLLFVGRTHPDL